MNRYVLRRAVHVHGRDFFGRRASVRLEPTCTRGWVWYTGGRDVPITPDIAKVRKNRIALTWGRGTLNVYEHLGVLRFAGLDNVRIVSETAWLPYDGSAVLFWEACRPHMVREGALERYCIPSVLVETEATRKGHRQVAFVPGNTEALVVSVKIDYPGLGSHSARYMFPGDDIVPILLTPTQGWPRKRRLFARSARLFGWPHAENIVWPQEHGERETLEMFARHRALDILGALSIVCPAGGIMVGQFESVCGGHKHDIALLQKTHTVKVSQNLYGTRRA